MEGSGSTTASRRVWPRKRARRARTGRSVRGDSAGSGRGSGRSRPGLPGARAPCRRTGGCPSRTRRAGSACVRCRAGRGRRTSPGRGLPSRCRASPACAARSATPPISIAQVVMRLPSWFELSKRRNSSTALLDQRRLGAAAAPSRRASRAGSLRPLPIRLVVVSWPALSRKMQLCSSSGARQPLAALARDQAGEHVDLGVAGSGAGAARRDLRGRAGTRAPRGCRARAGRRSASGSSAPRIASDQSRSGARSVVRNVEQVADDLDRDRARRSRSIRSISSPLPRAPSRRAVVDAARRGPAPSPRSRAASARPAIRRRTRVCSGGSLKTRLVVWCS